MHRVITAVSEIEPVVPVGYERHSEGYSWRTLFGGETGAVHTGLRLVGLEAGGGVRPHIHSYEECFYMLEGSAVLALEGRAYELREGDYGILPVATPHSWSGNGSSARWLEATAPPARIDPPDTFFVGDLVSSKPVVPDFTDRSLRLLGHWDDSALPLPGTLHGPNVTGISLAMMVDRGLDAHNLNLFQVCFQPAGGAQAHDHPFEECCFITHGSLEAILEGETYQMQAGDAAWTSVGGLHGFFNRGDTEARWIEAWGPQPPDLNAFRFTSDWQHTGQQLDHQ